MKHFLHLQQLVASQPEQMRAWLHNQIANHSPLIHTSVDVRTADFKVAHVDTNLFPAGFNNLTFSANQRAIKATTAYMRRNFPNVQNIMLVPESFTRNSNYLNNVLVLHNILTAAGYQVQVCFLPSTEVNPETNFLAHQEMVRRGDILRTTEGWQPDLILLNNDLTSGVPEILQGITQPIIPDLKYGWYRRKKSSNFEAFANLANQFAHDFDFDPWLISTHWHKCGVIDFRNKTGLECVANAVEKVLHKVQQKYNEYDIKATPHTFIKAENGTHGVGIMVVRSAEEVFNINKKQRHSMNILKSGVQNTEVIVQEGVPTALLHNEHTSENIVYLVGGQAIGLIQRVHPSKDAYANLNSSGMQLIGLDDLPLNLEVMIATLAALAAGNEED